MAGASYREVAAKTITRIPGSTDPWFLGRYGMNLYRGCEHGCVYCDGRAERYYVPGDFAREITVKHNAVAVLGHELARIREPGFVFIGGGVSDAYQPAEAEYRLARGALKLAREHRLPVHVLTKSTLVARDLDVLAGIAADTRAILSVSLQTLDDAVRARVEPDAAPIEARWQLLAEARERGLATGVMAVPVLPGISDQPSAIDALVARAASQGVDFVCGGGLTQRPGAQKDTYLALVQEHWPEHLPGYERLYRAARASGVGDGRYYRRVDSRFADALLRHGLPGRPPRRLFSGLIPRYAEAAVLLEHRDFERSLAGHPSRRLGRAGWALQQWARSRFARHRSRRYTWRHVEEEAVARVRDGSVLEIDGVTRAALPLLEEVLDV